MLEMVRKGKISIKQICETFGVSRQVLSRAMEKMDQAAVEALEPRKPGRKQKTVQELENEELVAGKTSLEKELDHWKQKYEVAKTFLDLQRKLERGETLPGEEGQGRKKTKNQSKRRKRKK